MAENCAFSRKAVPRRVANRRKSSVSRSVLPRNEKARRTGSDGLDSGSRENGLAEGGDTLCEPRELPRRGVLVEHALGDAAREFGLDLLDRGERLLLVAGGERRLDLLDEGADTADPRAVDFRAAVVAADSFLCLRRVRHRKMPLVSKRK